MKAIAAVNKKGYLGKDGKLMWHSREDFKHFKEKTKGGILIVGGKTFRLDLGGKALPGRIMVVIGQNPNHEGYDIWEPENVYYYRNIWTAVEGAILMADDLRKDIWLIGGASIYQQFWPLISELHLSVINDDQDGDVRLDIPADFRGTVIEYHFEPSK